MIRTSRNVSKHIRQIVKVAVCIAIIFALLIVFTQIPETNAWFTYSTTGTVNSITESVE
jgi:hypothetical protein